MESRDSGYLQTLDYDQLVELASAHDAVVRLVVRPGEFVFRGTEVVEVLCRQEIPPEFADGVRDAFVLGDQRTPAQDPEFVVHQLVEIAVRALSKGTNDPYTAVNCVDRLGDALVRIASRPRPRHRVRGPDGRVRLLRDPIDFPELACAALDRIREYGREHEDVLVRILRVLDALVDRVRRPRDLDEIRWHAEKVMQSGREGLPEAPSREVLADRYDVLVERIEHRSEELAGAAGSDAGSC